MISIPYGPKFSPPIDKTTVGLDIITKSSADVEGKRDAYSHSQQQWLWNWLEVIGIHAIWELYVISY